MTTVTPPGSKISQQKLKNGSHVALRPISPGDTDALRQAFEKLSPQTRYQRFHAAVRELSPDWLRYLTGVDGVGHVAWVAVQADEIVGVGRFVLGPEGDAAEVAFVVADELQGLGVGALLRDQLTEEARARGVQFFEAEVLPDNAAIRRLLQAPNLELRRDTGRQLRLALRPASEAPPRAVSAGAAHGAHAARNPPSTANGTPVT